MYVMSIRSNGLDMPESHDGSLCIAHALLLLLVKVRMVYKCPQTHSEGIRLTGSIAKRETEKLTSIT